MWLSSSSIGRKLVMAITGLCLILFVTFHVLMNAVAIFWPTAYNQVCQFLGANWYALVASIGLAALFIIHIIYALWLTLQNRKARGTDRYAVTASQPQVEWSSKNMLVLGIVVVAFLAVHMIQFWAKMQLQEVLGHENGALVNGAGANAAMGTLFIQAAFKEIWTPTVYIIGFVALWFHMNHGFWSMFQTAGWNNTVWVDRLKKTALVWSSVVVALFTIQVVVFTIKAQDNFYTNDAALQEQYAKVYDDQAKELAENFEGNFSAQIAPMIKDARSMSTDQQMKLQEEIQQLQDKYLKENAGSFIEEGNAIVAAYDSIFPNVAPVKVQNIQQLKGMVQQIEAMTRQSENPQFNR